MAIAGRFIGAGKGCVWSGGTGKTLAESWLQTSQLDYAILRHGGLLDGAATGKAQRIQNQECHGFVHRADVAAHIHELANAPALNQQVYSLIEPDLKPA